MQRRVAHKQAEAVTGEGAFLGVRKPRVGPKLHARRRLEAVCAQAEAHHARAALAAVDHIQDEARRPVGAVGASESARHSTRLDKGWLMTRRPAQTRRRGRGAARGPERCRRLGLGLACIRVCGVGASYIGCAGCAGCAAVVVARLARKGGERVEADGAAVGAVGSEQDELRSRRIGCTQPAALILSRRKHRRAKGRPSLAPDGGLLAHERAARLGG